MTPTHPYKIGVTTFGADGGRSGISRYVISLLENLAEIARDHQFEIIAYDDERDIFVPENSAFQTVAIPRRFSSPVRNILWHQLSLAALCRERGYDVLFLPAANRRLPLRSSCPTVGTVHDFSSLHVKGKYDSARMFYIKHILPFLMRRLTHVLTVSESSARDIRTYANVPLSRVTVTHLAADTELYHPGDKDAAKARIRVACGLDKPYILFVSRLEHPGKNHVALIKAFAKFKVDTGLPHQLALAGGDWFRAEAVHQAAEMADCAEDIKFLGFVDLACLPDLYRASDLFAFPSLYEGFGLPVLEAMACGVPVACSNVSSMPEVAGDAAVLFDPHDVTEMADAIRNVLTDPDLAASCIEKGIQRSRAFSWRQTAEATLEVLLAAAAGRDEVAI